MARLLQRSWDSRWATGEESDSPPWFHTGAAWLAALLLAGWPHLEYIAVRAVDGSDDPWGLLALITAFIFIPWEVVSKPVPSALRWGMTLIVLPLLVVAPYWYFDHALLRAACWVVAVGGLLTRVGAPPAVAGLLLMSLPVMASLDFYAGYPLRWLVSHSNALLLSTMGLTVEAKGVVLHWGDREVIVDAPCSGLRMLWFGGYLTFFTGALYRLRWGAMLLLAAFGFILVVVGNGLRSLVLFFPESGISGMVHFPDWAHAVVGLVIFAAIALGLIQIAGKLQKAGRS